VPESLGIRKMSTDQPWSPDGPGFQTQINPAITGNSQHHKSVSAILDDRTREELAAAPYDQIRTR
jgi:hypothetical protein